MAMYEASPLSRWPDLANGVEDLGIELLHFPYCVIYRFNLVHNA